MKNNIKLASVSVIGSSHLKKNLQCQDNNYKYDKNNIKILALSDGAGSKSHSHIGSKLLAKTVCEYVSKNFEKIYVGEYLSSRRDLMNFLNLELSKKIHSLNLHSIDKLASTLLFVAIKEDKFIIGHIGDGAIGYIKNEELKVISKPDNGEFANETYFVHPKYEGKMRLGKGILDGISGFILMTDGGESGLYHRTKGELIEANVELIKWLEGRSVGRVEKALRKNIKEKFRKITKDDCSIGLIHINEQYYLEQAYKNSKDFTKKLNLNLSKKKFRKVKIRRLL